MDTIDKLLDCSIVANTLIALTDVQSLLSIIILALQAVLIIYKLIKKIYNKIKNKDYSIEEDLESSIDELKSLGDKEKKDK